MALRDRVRPVSSRPLLSYRLWYPVIALLLAGTLPVALSRALLAGRGEDLDGPFGVGPAAAVVVSYVLVAVWLAYRAGRRVDALGLLATTDPLTDLPNRRLFDQRLPDEVLRALRYGTPLTVLAIDVDGLKGLNDRYGHAVGDAVLVAVGRGLCRACRQTDLAARVGGDEFAVVAPLTSAEQALQLAQRIHLEVRPDRELAEALERRGFTISIGVADLASTGATCARSLWRAADQQLYEAKGHTHDAAGPPSFPELRDEDETDRRTASGDEGGLRDSGWRPRNGAVWQPANRVDSRRGGTR